MEEVEKRAKYLGCLLDYFGLTLTAFDPGIHAFFQDSVKDGVYYDTLSFEGREWNWLEPLLEELVGWRESQ